MIEVVDEAEVNDAVRLGCTRAQTVGIVQIAAMYVGARGDERFCRGLRAGEREDAMSGGEELGSDCRADEAGRAGDENAHDEPPGLGLMSVTDIVSTSDVS